MPNNGQFERMCKVVGRTDLPTDPRFATNADRAVNRFVLKTEIESAFAPYNAEQLFTELTRVGVPCGVIQNVVEALAHPHTAHRDMVAEIGTHRSIASPIKLSRTPASYRSAPQQIGESTVQVLKASGVPDADIDALLSSGAIRQSGPADA